VTSVTRPAFELDRLTTYRGEYWSGPVRLPEAIRGIRLSGGVFWRWGGDASMDGDRTFPDRSSPTSRSRGL
jgi:hypothetical protein